VVCCGAIWRRREKSQYRCTTTIHRMYKIPNNVLENLLPVWLLVRTKLFIPIRFRLPVRNLTIAVSATWRNAEKSLIGAHLHSRLKTTAVEYSSNLLVIYTMWCANLFRRFLDFSKFWTAISWSLWLHLSAKKYHRFRKNLKTASKSAYKRQRNACTNYAPLERTALRPRSVTKN